MSGYKMRAPCAKCGQELGAVTTKSNQDVVRCAQCDAYQYCAPKTETGRAPRTVQTTHEAIKPKQRARILERASSKCELCGAIDKPLHVGHMLSVEAGHAEGLSDDAINSDDNLAALCDECNLGLGAKTVEIGRAHV
jgi:5-methylcytosine-specific restriction endonuclease McrA